MAQRIITIAQQKGGTGKTTTALAFGAGLAQRGHRVLFIDLDPQCNLTASLAFEGGGKTALDFLATGETAAIRTLSGIPGASIIPGDAMLAARDFSRESNLITPRTPERTLKERIKTAARGFDRIVIDTPPGLGTLTVNALTAATAVVIPCLADVFSIMATRQIAQTIEAVKARANPALKVAGILLTRYSARQILSREIAETLAKTADAMGTRLLEARIRESLALREAQARKLPIFDYAPRSNGAKDYNQAIDEVENG